MNDNPYDVKSFEEFWPHYLAMHSRRETQCAHALATLSFVALVAVGFARRQPAFFVLAPMVDFAIAQTSHRLFERNRTMPWKNPLWHARAEVRMARGTLSAICGLERQIPFR